MNIRFSTEAANADVLGEDTPPEGQPGQAGGREAARASERAARDRGEGPGRNSAKPGQDINAPGFLKDQDANKPS